VLRSLQLCGGTLSQRKFAGHSFQSLSNAY
jgi:hypothetical protein